MRAGADRVAEGGGVSYVYLEIEEVAKRLHCPVKSVYNLTRRNANGAVLEVVALPGGGKLVRPKEAA
jgi:hypothetical protein